MVFDNKLEFGRSDQKWKKCEIDQCVAAFWGLRGVCGGFTVFQDQAQDFGGFLMITTFYQNQ